MLSALAMLVGCGLLLIIVWGFLIPDWRTNNSYLQASAIVLDKRLDSQLFDVLNPKGRPVKQQERFKPEIKIRYEIEGRTFELWTYDGGSTYFDRDSQQAIIDSFVVGEKYPCWYDPDRPDQAVLVRSRSWGAYVFLILPIGLLVVGAAGFVIAWKVASIPPRQVDGDRRALES